MSSEPYPTKVPQQAETLGCILHCLSSKQFQNFQLHINQNISIFFFINTSFLQNTIPAGVLKIWPNHFILLIFVIVANCVLYCIVICLIITCSVYLLLLYLSLASLCVLQRSTYCMQVIKSDLMDVYNYVAGQCDCLTKLKEFYHLSFMCD